MNIQQTPAPKTTSTTSIQQKKSSSTSTALPNIKPQQTTVTKDTIQHKSLIASTTTMLKVKVTPTPSSSIVMASSSVVDAVDIPGQKGKNNFRIFISFSLIIEVYLLFKFNKISKWQSSSSWTQTCIRLNDQRFPSHFYVWMFKQNFLMVYVWWVHQYHHFICCLFVVVSWLGFSSSCFFILLCR